MFGLSVFTLTHGVNGRILFCLRRQDKIKRHLGKMRVGFLWSRGVIDLWTCRKIAPITHTLLIVAKGISHLTCAHKTTEQIMTSTMTWQDSVKSDTGLPKQGKNQHTFLWFSPNKNSSFPEDLVNLASKITHSYQLDICNFTSSLWQSWEEEIRRKRIHCHPQTPLWCWRFSASTWRSPSHPQRSPSWQKWEHWPSLMRTGELQSPSVLPLTEGELL